MATNANRDVRLTVDVQTLGDEGIRKLADQIRALGKSAGDASPQFDALGAEVDRLADQQAAITSFKALAAAVATAEAEQRNALATASQIGPVYAEQVAKAETLASAQKAANDTWVAAKKALADVTAALGLHRIELKNTEDATATQTAELKRLQEARVNATLAVSEAKAALQAAKEEAKAAAVTEKELAREHAAAAKAVVASAEALRQRNAALAEAQATASRLNVDTTALAASEERLRGALSLLASTAGSAKQELADLAAAQAAEADAAKRAQIVEEGIAKIRAESYARDLAAKLREEAAARETLAQAEAEQAQVEKDLVALQAVLAKDSTSAAIQRQAAGIRAKAEAEAFAAKTEEASLAIRRQALTQTEADTAALQQYVNKLEALAAASNAAAVSLPKAFDAAGVRSIQSIQEEIAKTERAMNLLRAGYEAGSVSAADFGRATTAAAARMQTLNAEIRNVQGPTTLLQHLNSVVMNLVVQYGALSAAVATVGYGVKPIYDTVVQLESMRRVLTQVFGSLDEANKQIAFVEGVANAAGLGLREASKAYQQFAVSAKTAGIDIATVNEVFKATANAAGNLGLGTERTGLILLALSQMANKGTVSMEELRKQLGESLPGALSLMAKGLGLTVPQLTKMVEAGQLLTEHALKPLADAMLVLGAPGGRVESVQAAMERVGNAIEKVERKIADTGGWKRLGDAAEWVATNFNAIGTSALVVAEAIAVSKIGGWIASWVALRAEVAAVKLGLDVAATSSAVLTERTIANTAATGANTAAQGANAAALRAAAVAQAEAGAASVSASAGAARAIGTMTAEVGVAATAWGLLRSGVSGVVALLGGIPGLALAVALNFRSIGEAIGETVAGWMGWNKVIDASNAKIAEAKRLSDEHAAAQQRTGKSWVQLTAQYNEQTQALKKNIEVAGEHVTAAKRQAEAIKTIADLSGDQATKVRAAAEAASIEIKAAEEDFRAKSTLAEATSRLVGELIRLGQAHGGLTEAEQKRLEKLQEQLKVEQGAADSAEALVVKYKAVAAAADEAAFKQADNASKVKDLKAAYEAARSAVTQMTIAYAQGRASLEKLNAAKERAAIAEGRYKDALNDTNAALDRQIQKIGLDAQTVQGAITVRAAYWKASEQVARSMGDERSAIEAQINARDIEVQGTLKEIQAKRDQADMLEKGIAQMREEANLLTGDALNAKLADIEVRKAQVQQMRNQAAASAELVRGYNAETEALRRKAQATSAYSLSGPPASKPKSVLGDSGSLTVPTAPNLTNTFSTVGNTLASEWNPVMGPPPGSGISAKWWFEEYLPSKYPSTYRPQTAQEKAAAQAKVDVEATTQATGVPVDASFDAGGRWEIVFRINGSQHTVQAASRSEEEALVRDLEKASGVSGL